ncbi:hypothetical protein B0H14DRAFT_2413882, partial [Mycena olivaceomarginata]
DRSSMSNFKKHAEACWDKDIVKSHLAGTTAAGPWDRNIFSSFACTGQCPIKVTHHTHTQPEEILLAGCPELTVPSHRTIGHDLNAAFDRCSQRIVHMLENYNGRVSFATDAWTSPNHRAFMAWMVHLQHEGQPLIFLLNIFEVPEIWLHISSSHIRF